MTNSEREAVREILGLPAEEAWFYWNAREPFSNGEAFAECYAIVARRRKLQPRTGYYFDMGRGVIVHGAELIRLRRWLERHPRPQGAEGATMSKATRRHRVLI
jgi:hypothetical protein